MRILTLLLVLSLFGVGTLQADTAHPLTPLQQAFVQTFHQQLEEDNGDQAEQIESQGDSREPAIPVRNLLPPPAEYLLTLRASAWLATAVTCSLTLAILTYATLRKLRRFYNEPRRKRRRQARQALKQLLSQNKQDLTPDLALPHLRDFFALPPAATLEDVAQAACQRNLHELAEACHEDELHRFAAQGPGAHRLHQALLRILSAFMVLLLGTAACSPGAPWKHAQALASQGNLKAALAIFMELNDRGPQSPELSQNIATLIALIPANHDSPQASSRQAWLLHATLQRQARQGTLPPELLLPCLPPLAGLIIILWGLRKRWAAAGTGLLLILLATLMVALLTPRLALKNRAVAIPQTSLYLTPDLTGNPIATFTEPTAVTLNPNTPELNGSRAVKTDHVTGWCKQENLIGFH